MSTEGCIKKMRYTYTILLSHKKEQVMPSAATWMDLEVVMLSEASQPEKDKYHTMGLLCGICKRIKMNFLTNRSRVTDVETKLMVIRGKAGEG